MSRKAFTLIELLVVIAIIAILAAILFPVFAQAKDAAKKTITLSNSKQLATSIAIYLNDNDDNFPIAYVVQNNQLIRAWATGINGFSIGADYPANVRAPGSLQHNVEWANSTYPYRKSHALTTISGAPTSPVNWGISAINTPEDIGLTFNGMLSTYNAGSISNPSAVPLIWPGLGKANVNGLAYTNPVLNCGLPPLALRAGSQCRFNPSGEPGYTIQDNFGAKQIIYGVGSGPDFVANSHFLYAGGTIVVRTDTSARFFKTGQGNEVDQNNNPFGDPWAAYEADGSGRPLGNYNCTSSGAPGSPGDLEYPCYFRPDRTQ